MLNLTTKAYIAITESIHRFKQNEKGVTAIEYGLIAVVMAALIIFVFYGDDSFVQNLKKKFAELTGAVKSQTPNFTNPKSGG